VIRSDLLLAPGVAEAEFVHPPGSSGNFALLIRARDGLLRQSIYPVSEMHRVLEGLDTSVDTWISQNRFFGHRRRLVNLLHIGLLFADLDTYNESWAVGKNSEQLVSEILRQCAQDGIPLSTPV